MNVAAAFRFLFRSGRRTVLAAVFWTLVPGLGQFVLAGYYVAIVAAVRAGDGPPSWRPIPRRLIDGIKLLIGLGILSLPVLVLVAAINGGTVALNPSSRAAVTEGVSALSRLLAIVFQVWFATMAPAVTIQYATTHRLRSLFRLRELVAIANRSGTSYLGVVMSNIMVTALGTFFLYLAFFPAVLFFPDLIDPPRFTPVIAFPTFLGYFGSNLIGTYWGAVVAHLYGQVAREADEAALDKAVTAGAFGHEQRVR